MPSNDILTLWNEIKQLLTEIDVDIHKNANGNASAGVRARKGLRLIKSKSAELTKVTVNEEKSRKTAVQE
jgi:hypothetical protein